MDTQLLVLFCFCLTTLYFHLSLGQEREMNPNSAAHYYTFPKDRPGPKYKFIAVVNSTAGICTGTIINKEWVMTSAHCVYKDKRQVDDQGVKVMAGVIDYELPNPLYKQEVETEQIMVHPGFTLCKPSKFDVALLKLKEPLEFNDDVGSIQVSGDGWPQTENETQNCMVLGFGGYVDTAPPTTCLKVWNVSAAHGKRACPCALRFQTKRLVCHVEVSMPLLCERDKGGPLICDDGKVRAIAHMIWNRSPCGDISLPLDRCTGGPDKILSLFFYLCPINDWLHSIIPDIPPKPESCRASQFIYSPELLIILIVSLVSINCNF